MPSWILTLSKGAFGTRKDNQSTRINADPLVGNAGPGNRIYRAGGRYPLLGKFGTNGSRHAMYVNGFVLDVILNVTRSSAAEGIIPFDWLSFAGWKDKTEMPPEHFWRTLVADRGQYGENAPTTYRRACQYAFDQYPTALNIKELLSESPPLIVSQFLERVQSVVWMKRLIRTERENLLGLVPDETEKKDLVCILFGCSVPVILRQEGLNETTGRPYFTLIGECYVHSMMEGAAFTLKLERNTAMEDQQFELR